MVVEVLMHQLPLGISSTGQRYLYCSKGGDFKAQYQYYAFKFKAKNCSTNVKGFQRVSVVSKFVVTHNFRKIASVGSNLAHEKEQPFLIPREREQVNESLPEEKVASQGDSVLRDGECDQSSRVAKRAVNLVGNRLLYLEERNEELLSRRILKLCRLNKVRSALELYRSMEFLGLQPNFHACNSVVSCLLRNDMIDDALRIFYSMKARGLTTGHTCSLILKAVAEARGCHAALSMFEELERDEVVNLLFDAVVYNTMISVFSKANDWIKTENIWRRLQDNGHSGTVVTYRLLVCTFVRCGQNELALDAYHEMVRNGLTPCEDVMQAIIGACVKEGKWDLALNVFQNMLNCGLKPNLIACNALINSLGKAGKLNLAFKVFDILKSLGHAPDAYTWNALLGALNRVNRHADAIHLFESIRKEQSSALSLQVYLTVLMSYQKLGLWDRALQLLWQMEASELPLTSAPYNLVIGACEVARQPTVALQIYDHMVHQKCCPDIFTLLSLIRTCIWGSLWDEVKDILNKNPPKGYLYNASVQGLFLRGNIDLAMELYFKMKEFDLYADGKTRALVLQNLPKGSRRWG
ncbi:hypothetical protein ACH5RR_011233 [Cinchona calisaya]|uniref:Pentatricopeptide repeat-containing protein n=1 Tax=Cinchona calisaya TaxID=153742 RepID=A0ABD3A7X3_9GENT